MSALRWLHTCAAATARAAGSSAGKGGAGAGVLLEDHPGCLPPGLCFPVRCSRGDVDAYCLRCLYKVRCDYKLFFYLHFSFVWLITMYKKDKVAPLNLPLPSIRLCRLSFPRGHLTHPPQGKERSLLLGRLEAAAPSPPSLLLRLRASRPGDSRGPGGEGLEVQWVGALASEQGPCPVPQELPFSSASAVAVAPRGP